MEVIITPEEEVIKILDKNKVEDLRRFLDKRACLNTTNQYFNYLFNFIQAGSIVLTSIGQAYQNPYCIWSGVSLASLAGVIHHIEASNQKISKTLLNNIKQIKANKYIDELILDLENENSTNTQQMKEKSLSFNGFSPATPSLNSVAGVPSPHDGEQTV